MLSQKGDGHMQRNWDLIRDLLEEIDLHPDFHIDKPYKPSIGTGKLINASADEVAYHLTLLEGAGMLIVPKVEMLGGYIGSRTTWRTEIVVGLSWAGQEFLASIRDESIWKKVKEKIAKHGQAVTFALITGVASSLIAARIAA